MKLTINYTTDQDLVEKLVKFLLEDDIDFENVKLFQNLLNKEISKLEAYDDN